MPQEVFDLEQVDPLFQKMCGKAVLEGMKSQLP